MFASSVAVIIVVSSKFIAEIRGGAPFYSTIIISVGLSAPQENSFQVISRYNEMKMLGIAPYYSFFFPTDR